MKKIFFISFLLLFNCSDRSKTLKFNVDCEDNISFNEKELNLNEVQEIVRKHRSKFDSDAKFKVEACSETSVKILVDLKNIIKLKTI